VKCWLKSTDSQTRSALSKPVTNSTIWYLQKGGDALKLGR